MERDDDGKAGGHGEDQRVAASRAARAGSAEGTSGWVETRSRTSYASGDRFSGSRTSSRYSFSGIQRPDVVALAEHVPRREDPHHHRVILVVVRVGAIAPDRSAGFRIVPDTRGCPSPPRHNRRRRWDTPSERARTVPSITSAECTRPIDCSSAVARRHELLVRHRPHVVTGGAEVTRGPDRSARHQVPCRGSNS